MSMWPQSTRGNRKQQQRKTRSYWRNWHPEKCALPAATLCAVKLQVMFLHSCNALLVHRMHIADGFFLQVKNWYLTPTETHTHPNPGNWLSVTICLCVAPNLFLFFKWCSLPASVGFTQPQTSVGGEKIWLKTKWLLASVEKTSISCFSIHNPLI